MAGKWTVGVVLALLVAAAEASTWKNLDEEHHLGGRMASEGYLLGKVVLVDRWGAKCPPCRALLPRVEEIWKSFKKKQFVVLGGHCEGWGTAEQVKALVEKLKLTYPVYEDAGLVKEPAFDAIPFLYVVDETGRIVYMGRDERRATEAVVTALTDMDAPRDVAQWKRFLDWELENLPAHAFVRLRDFRKKFPQEAKDYADKARELMKVPNVKDVAELVEFAKKAKDPPRFGPKEQAKQKKYEALVKTVLEKCKKMKSVADPRLQQEVKNALADLAWARAGF